MARYREMDKAMTEIKPNGHATIYPPGEDPLAGAFRSWRTVPS